MTPNHDGTPCSCAIVLHKEEAFNGALLSVSVNLREHFLPP